MQRLFAVVQPVGLDPENPTRFDVVVADTPAAFCGHTKSKTEAESWCEGIQTALDRAFLLGRLFQSTFNKNPKQ